MTAQFVSSPSPIPPTDPSQDQLLRTRIRHTCFATLAGICMLVSVLCALVETLSVVSRALLAILLMFYVCLLYPSIALAGITFLVTWFGLDSPRTRRVTMFAIDVLIVVTVAQVCVSTFVTVPFLRKFLSL